MAYTDKARMILEFGETELIQLTDRTGTEHAIVDSVIDRAMANAESEANSYLGSRYALPLLTVPEVLKAFVCDIARYRLYDDRATEEVFRRYERAVAWLRDVAKGVVGLGISVPDPEPISQSVVSSSRTQVFTDTLFGTMGPKWDLM